MSDANESESAFDRERRTLKDAWESGGGSTVAGEPRYEKKTSEDGTVEEKWIDLTHVGQGGVYTIIRHPDGRMTRGTSFPVGTRRVYDGLGSDGRPNIITRISDPPDPSDTPGPDFPPGSEGPTWNPQRLLQSSKP
jgi:hypothetical protein